MGIVDDLLANPGVYIGKDRAARNDLVGAARIAVTPLPGNAGVWLDYEVFNAGAPGPIRGHAEHTIVGKTHDGGAVMVVGHIHGSSVAILRETEPGVFELGDEPSPFPMKIVVSVPEPGKLHHAWWYGPADEEATEQDVADLELLT